MHVIILVKFFWMIMDMRSISFIRDELLEALYLGAVNLDVKCNIAYILIQRSNLVLNYGKMLSADRDL